MDNRFPGTNIYSVSIDHDENNTLLSVCNLYRLLCGNGDIVPKAMPVVVPYVLRKILRGSAMLGSVKYSSNKILNSGFVFNYDVLGIINEICQYEKEQ